MAATPVITHTEILCRAIRSVEAEITEWENRASKAPEDMAEMVNEMVARNVTNLRPKLETLKTLYRYETGTEYT